MNKNEGNTSEEKVEGKGNAMEEKVEGKGFPSIDMNNAFLLLARKPCVKKEKVQVQTRSMFNVESVVFDDILYLITLIHITRLNVNRIKCDFNYCKILEVVWNYNYLKKDEWKRK
jgi:hypothetical protein